ncbi:MAG: RNA polymerase sigma factor [Candidatus Obscuribacterales bacterium]|nr:RNA polymerase sigma factor [Candidatus Obscuribacterales bacterium]
MDLSEDEVILDKYRETKDPALFKSLVRRYQNRIYNAAFRILGNAEEAEEVVQDTCLKIHQGLDKFNRNSSFVAWVFRIAHNSCLDIIRLKQRKKVVQVVPFDPQASSEAESGSDLSGQIVSQAADPGPGPEEVLSNVEQGAYIAEKLNMLPDTQRVVLVLHDVEGFSYQEIAEIVGEKLGTVRSRLHYGRQKLRELLEPYYSAGSISKVSR